MATKPTSPWLSGLLVLVVISLVLGALWVSRPAAPIPLAPEPAAAPVHLRTVSERTRAETIRAYGETHPLRRVVLAAEQSGLVAWRAPELELGGEVLAGQPLIRLESGRLEQSQALAEAARVAALARVEVAERDQVAAEAERDAAGESEPLARREAERQRNLAETGDVPASVRDQVERAWVEARGRLRVAEARVAAAIAGVQAAHAGVGQAEQVLRQAMDELARSEIRAPFDAEVVQVHTEVGAWLAPGLPVVELLDRQQLRVRVALPNGEAARFAGDEPVRLSFPGFMLEDGSPRQGSAQDAKLAPQADRLSRSRSLELLFDNPGRSLPVGAFVEAEISLGERAAIWLRPSEFRLDPEGPRAVVVHEHRAELRLLRLGPVLVDSDGVTWHPVLHGLRVGESIAVDNLDSPVQGGPVLVLGDGGSLAQQ
jgi:multidrug efflux pump subunit AcrA (membrane-fusion protein)